MNRRRRIPTSEKTAITTAGYADVSAVRLLMPPAPPSPDISEAEFQRLIIDLAHTFSWECYHTLNSKGSQPGFPDLVLARECDGRVLFCELKAERGRLSREQARWGQLLLRAGLDWRLWRPSQWGEIVAALTQVQP